MGLLGIIMSSVGIVIIIVILYMMYRHRLTNVSFPVISMPHNRLKSWMSNGAYVNYYTT